MLTKKAGISFHTFRTFALLGALLVCAGCKEKPTGDSTTPGLTPVKITLDWRPEPEFGGFYQAQTAGDYKKAGLDVTLQSAGLGAPAWQLVANGQSEFATTTADLVLVGRAQGADVVALFAVFQTSPMGIMTHASRGFTSLQDIFTHTGTLAIEHNPWLTFLLNKFGKPIVTITGDSEGIAAFMANKDFSQQCYLASEPVLAKQQGGDPKSFLLADAGFNPYVTVLITNGKLLKEKPDLVSKAVAATRAGWQAYLANPSAANAAMGALNHDMDARTFAESAVVQKPLIETEETKKNGLGTMTIDRWKTLGQQLVDLKVIDKAPAPEECFVNLK